MKHADILIWCARKELFAQVKHADILIRYVRNEHPPLCLMKIVLNRPVSFCPDFEADDDNYQNTFIIGVGRGAPGGSSPHPQ